MDRRKAPVKKDTLTPGEFGNVHRPASVSDKQAKEAMKKTREISVFKQISLIEETHGELKIARARKNFITVSTHASIAIREKYKDTGVMLGEGAFGQVYLFEERANPENKVAVKIMRKELLTPMQ